MKKISECYKRERKHANKYEFDCDRDYVELHINPRLNLTFYKRDESIEVAKERSVFCFYYQRKI